MRFKKTYLYLLIISASILVAVEVNNAYGQLHIANESGLIGNATNLLGNYSKSIDIMNNLYVERLYDSGQTIVLRGEGPHFGPLGKAIDEAKKNGFQIDSVTVFTETSRAYVNTRYLTDIYTVFMSKK